MEKDVKTLVKCLEGCSSRKGSFCYKLCDYRENDSRVMVCEELIKDVIRCLKGKEQQIEEQVEYYLGQTLYIPGNPYIKLLEEDRAYPVIVREIRINRERTMICLYCNIYRESYSIYRNDYYDIRDEGEIFFKNKEDALESYMERRKNVIENTGN